MQRFGRLTSDSGGGEARDEPRVGALVGDHRDHVQHSRFGVAGCPQPLQVPRLHPPGLTAELPGELNQLLVTILSGLGSAEGFCAFPIRGLFRGDAGQKPTFTPT